MKSLFFLSLILLSVFGVNSANAQSITINASNAPYNLRSALNNISIYSALHDHTAAVSDAASWYRSQTAGFAS
jgi:glycosylphosphatidylinositol transamidase (GPIT) subunit GPI8